MALEVLEEDHKVFLLHPPRPICCANTARRAIAGEEGIKLLPGEYHHWRDGITQCIYSTWKCDESAPLCRCHTADLFGPFSGHNLHRVLDSCDSGFVHIPNVLCDKTMLRQDSRQVFKKLVDICSVKACSP